MSTSIRTNFAIFIEHDPQLLRLGMLAERYFTEDPNTSVLKIRQFAELLAQRVASEVGEFTSTEEPQYELLRRLQDSGVLPREVAQLFGHIRRTGNAANHSLAGDHDTALSAMRFAWQLSIWFQRTFVEPAYASVPFLPPAPPQDPTPQLLKEITELRQRLSEFQAAHAESVASQTDLQEQLASAKSEQQFWADLAQQEEAAKIEANARLAQLQAAAIQKPSNRQAVSRMAAQAALNLSLDEAQTRAIIDEQLRQSGWEADTQNLAYGTGARPEKGKNRAIAEWPTSTGPADYILFCGLTPIATVEAKRANVDVSGSLQQAQRYARSYSSSDFPPPQGSPWDNLNIPFAFSTNGRPYLRQLETKSGIWFRDLRRSSNLPVALDGWKTPEGLLASLASDPEAAEAKLQDEGFEYGFTVRDYQRAAIQAVEEAIQDGQRSMLVAMATGTGKTKTCIALIYRLLKVKRFRRVLFLVDRTSLGEQAANAFKETRMESLQTFADIFGIKEIDEQLADPDTCVHIATIQGMVKRVLYPGENQHPPSVDAYDCVIVDECHRGYLLDREMADSELLFRGFEDYVSKYRRVLDYFDAFKIGLTATPALHTTEIFGRPVFVYSYREAVIDGFLNDHEPPIRIDTELSTGGIQWKVGETVKVYNPGRNAIDLFNAPDEIKIEVDEFNRKVVTESFNRVVCQHLAKELDPKSPQKTLIFCANTDHADLVVKVLKEEFEKQWGSVDDDAVLKITGNADKPLELIRRFKNERYPNVAVTVDLLTTGIDVPEICNLVFLRRVNSRILYDQMLGRATRLCPEIGKEAFRVFDAVQLYDALKDLTDMQPVVVNPTIEFATLQDEIASNHSEEHQALAVDQFLAKFQRKKAKLDDQAAGEFEAIAGMKPTAFVNHLRSLTVDEIAAWFTQHPGLGELLDRKTKQPPRPILISEHEDALKSVQRGYGDGVKPEDYLDGFKSFLNTHRNSIPALITVLTKPRDLTRKDLRELAIELDKAGFNEAGLTTAWREAKNVDIAARIVGFVRQAALGDPLVPYDQRVDQALQSMLSSRAWSTPQRQWLQRIAAQIKANVVVDAEMLDDPQLLFKREGGGSERLNRLFEGELFDILAKLKDAVWA
ncbi:MAG: type I restriction-modification system endonuclease [Methanoregulaceae archaeon]|nr:type I restriction-modification system endonuclease [Methanoregulaceae archaeon]